MVQEDLDAPRLAGLPTRGRQVDDLAWLSAARIVSLTGLMLPPHRSLRLIIGCSRVARLGCPAVRTGPRFGLVRPVPRLVHRMVVGAAGARGVPAKEATPPSQESDSADMGRKCSCCRRGPVAAGWVDGEGPRVLAIHGGPGLNFDYLDDAVVEPVAATALPTYQQRDLAPPRSRASSPSPRRWPTSPPCSTAWADTAYLWAIMGGPSGVRRRGSIPERLAGVLSVTRSAQLVTARRRRRAAMLARIPKPCVSVLVPGRAGHSRRGDARGDPRGVLVVLGVVLRRSFCCAAHAPHRVLHASEPRAVGGPGGPPARAGGVATGDPDPRRRARRRTESDAPQRRSRQCRSGSRCVVTHRAGCGTLHLARIAGLSPGCHGSDWS